MRRGNSFCPVVIPAFVVCKEICLLPVCRIPLDMSPLTWIQTDQVANLHTARMPGAICNRIGGSRFDSLREFTFLAYLSTNRADEVKSDAHSSTPLIESQDPGVRYWIMCSENVVYVKLHQLSRIGIHIQSYPLNMSSLSKAIRYRRYDERAPKSDNASLRYLKVKSSCSSGAHTPNTTVFAPHSPQTTFALFSFASSAFLLAPAAIYIGTKCSSLG